MAFVPVNAVVPAFSGLRAAGPLSARRRAAPASPRATRVRMIAAEPSAPAVAAPTTDAAPAALTPRARELLSYIRAHKSIFRPGLGFNSTTATLTRKNDTGRSFTPADELDTNAHELAGVSVARHILDEAEAIVAAGVAAIEAEAPQVAQNDELRDIVSFNFTTVLRAVSYAASVQSDDYVHTNNVGMMKMLHDELAVAPAAIAAGMDAMKKVVVDAITEDDLVETTGDCFDAMKEHLA